MNIQVENSAHYFRVQSEREQTLGNCNILPNLMMNLYVSPITVSPFYIESWIICGLVAAITKLEVVIG